MSENILLPLVCSAKISSFNFQAGNLGLLQGAERFDPTRGYRFSTYVQYWIRKSMLKIVERHARGIQIPVCYFFYVSEKRNRTSEIWSFI